MEILSYPQNHRTPPHTTAAHLAPPLRRFSFRFQIGRSRAAQGDKVASSAQKKQEATIWN